MVATDFRLTLKVKLTPNDAKSAVVFRGDPSPGGATKGLQLGFGDGRWGKIYENNSLGIISDNPGDKYTKPNEWNEYEIIAQGSHIKTLINGQLCADVDDKQIARRGMFALQLGSGRAMEVRVKEIRLEVTTATKAAERE